MMQAAQGGKRLKNAGILLAAALLLAACLVPVAHAADTVRPAGNEQTAASAHPADEPGNAQSTNGAAVLEAFDQQQVQRVKQASELNDHNKRVIMFALAVPLFILLLITGGLGIATGVYGKKLFIPHMICAGLTITLALAHAIAGIVWFYPF